MKKTFPIIVIFILVAVVTSITVKQCDDAVEEKQKNKELQEEYQRLKKDYFELKIAYEKRIEELEDIIEEGSGDIKSFKNRLKNLLTELNHEIDSLENNPDHVKNHIDDYHKNIRYYEKAKEKNNKDIAKVQNGIIRDLETRIVNLEQKLEKYIALYEVEKRKNLNLSSQIAQLQEDLENEKRNRTLTDEALRKKKAELDELWTKQNESEEKMKEQESEINKLAKDLNKVNVNCYFVYKENSSRKKLRVYLNDEGLSKIYYKYFKRKEPDVKVTFKINPELFKDEREKLKLFVNSAENGEIYQSDIPTSSGSKVERTINGNKFSDGQYTIYLKYGTDDIIVGKKYSFQIKEKGN